jgi:hypothetical protein
MMSDQMITREFWQALAPGLHIEDSRLFQNTLHLDFGSAEQTRLITLLNQEGYIQAHAEWSVDLDLMADTVRSLSSANLSPVFAFLYDEFWCPFLELHSLYLSFFGGKYFLMPAFWVWNVDPMKNEAGWKPHRDRGRASLFNDGSPKSVTTWIPLSMSTPLNGCIYIVPALYDQTYATADELTWKFEFQNVRALPAKPGDFFIWNQAVLHWGGKTSSQATESRVSMALELQRADVPAFVEPLLDPLDMLSFEARLRLIAKQILRYRNMHALDAEVARFASKILAV